MACTWRGLSNGILDLCRNTTNCSAKICVTLFCQVLYSSKWFFLRDTARKCSIFSCFCLIFGAKNSDSQIWQEIFWKISAQNLLWAWHFAKSALLKRLCDAWCEHLVVFVQYSALESDALTFACRAKALCSSPKRSTVETLITHTFPWMVRGMGYEGIWVRWGRLKIDSKKMRKHYATYPKLWM